MINAAILKEVQEAKQILSHGDQVRIHQTPKKVTITFYYVRDGFKNDDPHRVVYEGQYRANSEPRAITFSPTDIIEILHYPGGVEPQVRKEEEDLSEKLNFIHGHLCTVNLDEGFVALEALRLAPLDVVRDTIEKIYSYGKTDPKIKMMLIKILFEKEFGHE